MPSVVQLKCHTVTCEVYHLNKAGGWANRMKWSFIIAGENLVKSKEELRDDKLVIQRYTKGVPKPLYYI